MERWLLLAMGAALVGVLIGLVVVIADAPPPAERGAAARRWADAMGLRVGGVQCSGGCDLVTSEGRAIRLWCDREACSLRGAP